MNAALKTGLLSLLLFWQGNAHAFETTGVIWAAGKTEFKVNFAMSNPGLDAKFQAAFEEALGIWTATSTFEYELDNSVAVDPCLGANAANSVAFSNTNCGTAFGSSTLAIQTAFISSGVRIRSRINFNSGINWDVYNGPRQMVVEDFRRVVVHELGHGLGLSHSSAPVAIMRLFVSSTEVPQADDLDGVDSLYDLDNDGAGFANDNCPVIANADQANIDMDALGDVCDSDIDNDGVFNSITTDQSFSDNGTGNTFFTLGDAGSDGLLAQTFKVSIAGSLDAITLPIHCPSGDLQISIQSLAGQNPSGSVLDSITFANGFTRTNQGFITIDLPGTAVAVNDQLAIVVASSGECRWFTAAAGSYPDGSGRFTIDGVNWFALADDLPFSTLVTPAVLDNCAIIANPGQEDLDMDNVGDVCEDSDNDGVLDGIDNCLFDQNPDQLDFDNDNQGDICDNDIDGDSALNANDSDDMNRFICSDDDADSCDDCSLGTFNVANDGLDSDSNGICNLGDPDDDNDTILDGDDNCPITANLDQADSDMDGIGDACQDIDDFCVPIKTDNGRLAVICL